MKKIKNMLKKGGVADIVTLMVIVGLVIALIIAVILPMVDSTEENADSNEAELKGLSQYTTNLGTIDEDGNYTIAD